MKSKDLDRFQNWEYPIIGEGRSINLSLLQNRSCCKKTGITGRRLTEGKFDIKIVVDKHMEIYEGLLKSKLIG